MKTKNPKDFEQYLLSFPEQAGELLKQVRATIKKAAPQAQEVISYGMPAFKWNGMLAWFAAHTNHIGFYPGASGISAFKKEISKYKNAKGSVQFPFDQPIPLGLITKMIKFRLKENSLKIKRKTK